jgi:hypothetical protein
MESLNNFVQVDLSSIKKSNIHTEKELENEVAKIYETLKDTCKIAAKFYL